MWRLYPTRITTSFLGSTVACLNVGVIVLFSFVLFVLLILKSKNRDHSHLLVKTKLWLLFVHILKEYQFVINCQSLLSQKQLNQF